MLTIHARNMKKSAFIRSQLEASKIGQKVKKSLKIQFLPLSLKCHQTITFEPVINGWVQTMRAEEEEREREKEEKRKGGKMGIKIVLFFYKFTRMFFHMRSGHFSDI